MLQTIHDKYKGWIAWSIVLLLSVTLGIWGIENYFHGGHDQNVAAKVNGRPITQQQLQATFEQLRANLEQQLAADIPPNPVLLDQLKQAALDQLITQTLLIQLAAKNGYRVTAEQAGKTIMKIPAFQEHGKFSPKLYEHVLEQANQTPGSFLNQVQIDMVNNQVQYGIMASNFLLPQELNETIAYDQQSRDFAYMMVKKDSIDGRQIKPALPDMRQFYSNHQAMFMTPEKVSVEYVQLNYDDVLKNQQVTEEEIKAAYQENVKQYTRPEERLVTHILIHAPTASGTNDNSLLQIPTQLTQLQKRIKHGEKFEQLARRYSQDKLTASHGGVMPWVKLDQTESYDPAFIQAIQALKKPGDVSSAPVKTRYGWHLIKLLAIKPSQSIPFANLREKIKQQLVAAKAQKAFSEKLDQLSNLGYMNPDSLKPAADELNLKIQNTGLFTNQGEKAELLANSKLVQAAFSEGVLKGGNNSEVIALDNQHAILLRIKQHVPSQPKPFEAVQKQIEGLLIKQAQSQKAEELGTKLVNALEKNTGQASNLMQQQHLQWVTVKNAKRYSTAANVEILRKAFSLGIPTQRSSGYTGMALASGDYVVIRLDRIIPGKLSDLSVEQRRLYAAQLGEQLNQLDYELYVRSLMDRSKIRKYI